LKGDKMKNINNKIDLDKDYYLNHEELPLTAEEDDIKVGMGATYSNGSDSYAFTVVEVRGKVGKRQVTLQKDNAVPTKDSDYYGHQKHLFVPNQETDWFEYVQERDLIRKVRSHRTYNPSNLNKKTGRLRKQGFGFVYIGERSEYKDPHR
tara:strand:+ start:1093 stop:1542 length:450 start_codon:yes stop_codon:yes gene_type:complete